jgi:hypothetical protein
MLLDTDTLCERFPGPAQDADEFAGRLRRLQRLWLAECDGELLANWSEARQKIRELRNTHRDPAQRRKALDDWLALRSITRPGGFELLVTHFFKEEQKLRWAEPIRQLIASTYEAENWRAPLADTRIAEVVAKRIERALSYGDLVVMSTRSFGDQSEDQYTAVPGLGGGHGYSVVGVERTDATTTIVLENPWSAPPMRADGTPRPPIAGIEYGERGIVKVDIAHLNKFDALAFEGPGAHVLYGPDPEHPLPGTPPDPYHPPDDERTTDEESTTDDESTGDESMDISDDERMDIDDEDPAGVADADAIPPDSRMATGAAGEAAPLPGHHTHDSRFRVARLAPATVDTVWPSYRPADGRIPAPVDDDDEFAHLGADQRPEYALDEYLPEPLALDPDDEHDTFFGGLFDDPAGITLLPNPARPHVDETGLRPPDAATAPVADEPAAMLTLSRSSLTLVGDAGELITVLPTSVVRADPDPTLPSVRPDGTYRRITVDGSQHWVRAELLRDFAPDSATGRLTQRGISGVRLIADDGRPVILPGGAKVTVREYPAHGYTVIHDPVLAGRRHRVPTAPATGAGLGGLRRPPGSLFGTGGPAADDVVQGRLADCFLLAPLKNLAQHNPLAIVEMTHDYGDNTFGVRFFRQGTPVWVRVTRNLYADADGNTLYAQHGDAGPLWPAIIEKAYAVLRGRHRGYRGLDIGESRIAAEDLRSRSRPGGFGMLRQPTRLIEESVPLHPMLLDADTLHERFPGPAEFTAKLDALRREWETERDRQSAPNWPERPEEWSELAAAQSNQADADQALTEWLGATLVTEPVGFANFVDRHFSAAETAIWAGPIADLKKSAADAADWQRPFSDSAVAEAFANRIDYALAHGDTVLLGTGWFGAACGDVTRVPGLVGGHAYSVVGIERDATTTKIVLDNPHGAPPLDADRIPVVPIAGIEYGDGGLVKVGIAHVNKFMTLVIDGPGAHLMYGPDPAPTAPARQARSAVVEQPATDQPRLGGAPHETGASHPDSRFGAPEFTPDTIDSAWPSYHAAAGRPPAPAGDEDEFAHLGAQERTHYEPAGAPVELDENDTYFGALFDDPAGITLMPDAARPHPDDTGLRPPDAADLPIGDEPASIVTLPRKTLRLVDKDGRPVRVPHRHVLYRYTGPTSVRHRADGTYRLIRVKEARHWVREDLMSDFTWDPNTGRSTRPDDGGVRFVDDQGSPVKLVGGGKVIARPDPDRGVTVVVHPVTGAEHPMRTSRAAATGLGRLRRPTGTLFGDGGPGPDDVRQGRLGDCYLLAPLKNLARHNPHAILEMVHDYGDNTFGVRFFKEGVPEWVRVTGELYVDLKGRTLYARGEAGPFWPAIVEKGYATLRGGYRGYPGIVSGRPAIVAGDLRPRLRPGGFGMLRQPTRLVEETQPLHPMLLDTDTLRERFAGPDATEFAARLDDLHRAWQTQHDREQSPDWPEGQQRLDDLCAIHPKPDDMWKAYREWKDRTAVGRPVGFANFVDRHFSAEEHTRWAARIADLKKSAAEGEDWRTPLSDTVIAEAVANRIAFALTRGDTVTIGTRRFEDGIVENIDRVPGLVGGHAYSVVGVERDGATARIVLDNPWSRPPPDANTQPVTPIAGIEYGERGIVKVDIAHLNKFDTLGFDGPGGQGLYGPEPESRDDAASGPKAEPQAPPQRRYLTTLFDDEG